MFSSVDYTLAGKNVRKFFQFDPLRFNGHFCSCIRSLNTNLLQFMTRYVSNTTFNLVLETSNKYLHYHHHEVSNKNGKILDKDRANRVEPDGQIG